MNDVSWVQLPGHWVDKPPMLACSVEKSAIEIESEDEQPEGPDSTRKTMLWFATQKGLLMVSLFRNP
jgi:hypothetical protein